MRSKLCAASLALAAIVVLAGAVAAAPALYVNKGPVVPPNGSWTGPFGDPHAAKGQWFIPRFAASGMEEYRPYEFYDNVTGSGGGGQNSNAIKGIARNVQVGATGNIVAFDVVVTVSNDSTVSSGVWTNGLNRHGESLSTPNRYGGIMYGVKLTADFAVDPGHIPGEWGGVRTKHDPLIYSTDNDMWAWYCWTPTNTAGLMPLGGYFVPAWTVGPIPVNQSITKTLHFTVADPGIPAVGDARYAVIMQSQNQGRDMFLNRTTSLKISDWVNDCYIDNGTAYPAGSAGGHYSDVSVFFDSYQSQPDRDWGDALDPPYTTLGAAGANHIIVAGFCLGQTEDGEVNGQPDPNALGDDNNNVDDEDGVVFLTPLTAGQPAKVQVFLTNTAGINPALLSGWIDFNGDGDWNTAGDQIITNQVLVAGINVLNFPVPATATPGVTTFARFRLSSVADLQYSMMAKDGEVEDYTCFIEQPPAEYRDFGDAPGGALAYPSNSVIGQFPTCKNVGPAGFVRHNSFGGQLGPSFDFELDGNAGQCPTFNPNTYNQDECFQDGDAGLLFPPAYTIQGPVGGEAVVPCTSQTGSLGFTCQTATWGGNVDIEVHNHMPSNATGYMNVLMDWDQNGAWGGASQCLTAAAPEHVLVNFPIPNPYDGPLSARARSARRSSA